jgi:hypothetical protein
VSDHYRAWRDNELIGVDHKSWGPDVEASRVRAKLTAITGARFPFPVLIVTPQDVQVPHGLSLPAGMEMLPFREFRARLRTAIIS